MLVLLTPQVTNPVPEIYPPVGFHSNPNKAQLIQQLVEVTKT
uniref:Uncharacterized protein n=1 Tax=Anguilla anguilla TaxID=7936 RepID=A0A0E9T8E7_ANGAN